MTTAWVKGTEQIGGERKDRAAFYDEVLAMHTDAGIEMKSPEELADELGVIGEQGLALALNNGLNDEENLELATSGNAIRLVELILRGLERKAG